MVVVRKARALWLSTSRLTMSSPLIWALLTIPPPHSPPPSASAHRCAYWPRRPDIIMSRAAKITLGASFAASALIVWGVHFLQQRERDVCTVWAARCDTELKFCCRPCTKGYSEMTNAGGKRCGSVKKTISGLCRNASCMNACRLSRNPRMNPGSIHSLPSYDWARA